MSNSLRSKISKLRYEGNISQSEYEELISKLDGHDKMLIDSNELIHTIKEWYWSADKQALAKDPCVVDAMIDLFIRTIKDMRK